MSLYFFINHIVRSYINRGNPGPIYPEMSSLTREEKNMFRILPTIDYKWYRIQSDRQLSTELSINILANFNKYEKLDNKKYFYCELMYIAEEISKMVYKGERLTPESLRYLFLVYHHYSLNSPLVYLLYDLMRDQKFFLRRIIRVLNYPFFREWITLRTQVNDYKYYCLLDASRTKWYKTDLFDCFKHELQQSGEIAHFKNKKYKGIN